MFSELHIRSAFSFLRGASRPDVLADAVAAAGVPVAALCDRDGIYGSARFHAACKERGVRAVVGAELTLEDGSALPVLVESRRGYQNLCQLITKVQLRAPKGRARVRYDELPEYSGGLIALTGCYDEGPLAMAMARGGIQEVERVLGLLMRAFAQCTIHNSQCTGKNLKFAAHNAHCPRGMAPDADPATPITTLVAPGASALCIEHCSLCIELVRHQRRGERRWERVLRDIAERTGLPLIASNIPCYATPGGRFVQDVFTCMHAHTHLDAAGRLLAANAERHIKSAAGMQALFADLPLAVGNTLVLAERCAFGLEDLGYEFPRYPVPAGETMDSFLRKLTWFGAEQRYGSLTPPIRQQLEHELALIAKLGFSGYFLIVWDIVNHCREHGIMVQGRGSAANSAVCYSLGITAVDPIGGRLLFERFLSEGRKSWPDIDLDLPSGERRESVIQEVYRRYGKHGAAMTANVITYRGRSAGREVVKALNLPEDVANRFSSLFAHGDYPQTLEVERQLQQAGLPPDHPRYRAMVELFQQVRGLPRHLGQHSGGMIICQGQLSSVVPLENASMPGRVVAQWDKDDCEDLGIIKVDLLGLGMMAAMQDALELTRRRGHPVDLAHIPKDDPQVFEMMRAADTVGVFQIESRAQMATLPRLKPECFYDVVIQVAIIRPGPIQGDMVHPYLERRAGRQDVDYIHPDLRPVLERTLGVCLFQEQILKIAMVMAGFTGSDAEDLRRSLNMHRESDRLERSKRRLDEAMTARGVDPEVRRKIVQALSSFALYGFPESHAISFALIAYGSAYLKVHHPAEFYCALLNNQPMGFYSPDTLIRDAARHGLKTLPPCAVHSDWDTTVVDDRTIRLGLRSVKGLSERHIRALMEQRARRPFAGGRDFMRRAPLDADERRALAAVGALNVFYGHRRAALWHVAEQPDPDSLWAWADGEEEAENGGCSVEGETAKVEGEACEVGGGDIPGVSPSAFHLPPSTVPSLSPLEAMSHIERLQADYLGMELTTGRHPMAHLRARLPHVWRACDLKAGRHGQRITIAGAVICRQRPGTAKGFVFLSLEDETGIANAIVRPDLFESQRLVITQEPSLFVTGILQKLHDVICVRAEHVEPLIESKLPTAKSHDFH